MKHFGVTVPEGKCGLRISREHYAIPSTRNTFGGENYSAEWCERQKQDALENYDLNMRFFSLLDHKAMDEELQDFLRDHPEFSEIEDLKQCEKVAGYYIMVLDEYCQLYIGTSTNIKNRIWEHWVFSRSFDRLIYGNKYSSKISIDSFRALDTTRIFVAPTPELYIREKAYIACFSNKFLCNRQAGGLRSGDTMVIEDFAVMKRKLLK